MKNLTYVSMFVLLLLSFATSQLCMAQTAGSSATGSYKFILEDKLTKYVEFDARTDDRGVTTGAMTFNDQALIPDQADDDDPKPTDAPPQFYIKAELNALTVEKNRALMSGTVLDSSHRSYIGKFVQLVVEDNGDNLETPDRLTWGFCRPEAGGWIPSDAEVKGDNGAWMSWWATDAERKDDVGMPSPNLIPGERRACPVYPIWTYSFVDVLRGDGNIQVIQP